MMKDMAGVFKSLRRSDFRVLTGIEVGMKYHEWVPVEELPGFANMDAVDIEDSLGFLLKNKLIRMNRAQYTGYSLYFDGYDMLALNTLSARGSVTALGDVAGVGKESVVYEAKSGSIDVIIKFHREGTASFRNVRRKRGHIEERRHFSWIYAARLAASREYRALKTLYPDVAVPEPVDHNRHAVVMAIAGGTRLISARLDEPDWFLGEILRQVSGAYAKGIIHADLSEYNIFVSPGGISIIDWPQYIGRDHPNADELLHRDIKNILDFFERKYGIKRDPAEVLKQITGSAGQGGE
ncbi:MAG TPA: serine/threonine protein kinase [Candidatus Methanoperedenaceae archaeon]|nr:serine/threonine protein kinase [Candidatus Methanoperedenaceae archaeon]